MIVPLVIRVIAMVTLHVCSRVRDRIFDVVAIARCASARPMPPLSWPCHADLAWVTLAAPGDVLVIGVGGDTSVCSWGEAHTLRATARGLGGVLINGATRDSAGIARRAFPLSCVGYSPIRSAGRLKTIAIGRAVRIGKLTIRPGDIVALDGDGVVCVPAERADDVLAKARQIRDYETSRDRELEVKLRGR